MRFTESLKIREPSSEVWDVSKRYAVEALDKFKGGEDDVLQALCYQFNLDRPAEEGPVLWTFEGTRAELRQKLVTEGGSV